MFAMQTPGSWDGRLASMVDEWRGCSSPEFDLKKWQAHFDSLLTEECRLREEGFWQFGPDDFFGVLGIARDENRHSAMIAWLLDPAAHHGLRTSMLKGLLVHLELPVPEQLALARTVTEESRQQARVDIVVRSPGLTLIIENKVDAVESVGQCDEYFRLYRQETGACFVFLTPDGRPPETAYGEAKEAFKRFGYRDLQSLLEQALDRSSGAGSTPGRRLAYDYLKTLKREFL
ncbi:MAG: PD-(D/E)XK nuclease family protein [Polyangiaceae bacterium]